MKNLIILLLFAPLLGIAQQRNQLTPTGFVASLSPFTTLNGGTEQNMYADTLKANTLAKYQNYHFEVYANATTGVGLSNLTVKLKVGANTITLISALAVSVSQTNKPFVIKGIVVNQGSGNAYIYCSISQDGSTPINTIVSYYDKRLVSTLDFSSPQYIYVTGQLTGIGLGTTTIGVDFIKRNNL